MAAKTLYTGKTHTTAGANAATSSSDGQLNLKLAQPHPAAENLFAAAWSACYLAAIQHAASMKKIKMPPEPAIDTQIDLAQGDGGFFLRAQMKVSLPGVDREVGENLIEEAHGICPYSKAVHGNIEVTTTLA
jgi:Ohr subfamily peroxiredoxin